MDIKEFQVLSAEIISQIDEKYNIKRNEQLTLSQFVEELGELAKEVNKRNLRNQEPTKKDLEDEFADVFLQFAKLAHHFDIDLEKAVLDKIETLKGKHSL